jgi:hypothetical protein
VSQLETWFRELRDGGKSEAEALEVMAGRLGETVIETKRIVSAIGGVRLRGRAQGGNRPSGGPRKELDVPAVQASYRSHRGSGLDSEKSVRAIARELDERPHSIRKLCGVIELELRRELVAGATSTQMSTMSEGDQI